VVFPFAPEVPAGEPLQLGPNQGQKPFQGAPVAFPPNGQQSRDLARLVLHASSPSRGTLRESYQKTPKWWCPPKRNVAFVGES
jgi:hypothetical protein